MADIATWMSDSKQDTETLLQKLQLAQQQQLHKESGLDQLDELRINKAADFKTLNTPRTGRKLSELPTE